MQEKNFYPWNLAFCGDIDICGWKRPQSYYRDILWNANRVELFVTPPLPSFPMNEKKEYWSIWNWEDHVADWNWTGFEGKPITVNAYSSCEEAELFFNGKSFGKHPTSDQTRLLAQWKVPYQPGELKVIGYSAGIPMDSAVLKTAGNPSRIVLSPDRTEIKADGQDLCYVTIELKDESGALNPKAENLLQFSVKGPGSVLAVGSANPVSIESYNQPYRHAWRGKCLVILKAGKVAGEILLKVTSDGLPAASVRINTSGV
jgi:beta-galactosidase